MIKFVCHLCVYILNFKVSFVGLWYYLYLTMSEIEIPFCLKLLYLNVTILPIVITLMVVCYVILYQIIIIKNIEKRKKSIQSLLVSFPPWFSIYNVLLWIIILCHILYHASDKCCIMWHCIRWNCNISHIFFV
jgi:hypothetical protein